MSSESALEASISLAGATPERSDLVGRKIGRLLFRGYLGGGNMGEVYLAFDEKLEREVAVKVVRGSPTEKNRLRLAREARLLCQLDHPNICRLHELIELPDTDLLVLERIHGRSLDLLPPVSLRERLRIAEDIATALAVAHQKGVIHRDLKPANVMLTDRGEVKVLDFGIARHEAETSRQDETIGRLGTFAYMSPEQVRGELETAAGDVFSLGLLLQELFTGQPSYPRNLPWAQLLARVSRGETEPLPETLDPELRRLLGRMLAELPEARPSLAEVIHSLGRLRDRPRRRRRRWLLAGLAALALGGLAKYTLDLRQERRAVVGALREAEAVSTFLTELLEVNDPWGQELDQGENTPVGVLLERAAARLDSDDLIEQPEVRSRLMLTIGALYRKLGDYQRARPLLEEAVAMRRRQTALDPLALAQALDAYASWKLETGDVAGAEALLREAIALLENRPEASSQLALTLANLAGLLRLSQRTEGAEDVFRRSSELAERLGPETLVAADSQHNLAELYRLQGRLDRAEPLYLRSLAIREKLLGSRHLSIATISNNLGLLYQQKLELDKSRAYYERNIEISSQRMAPDHPMVANNYTNYADLLMWIGDLRGAEQALVKAGAVRAAARVAVPADLAQLALSQAWLAIYRGDCASATDAATRGMELLIEADLTRHRPMTYGAFTRGMAAYECGELELAETWLRRTLAVYEELGDSRNPRRQGIATELARQLLERGELERARELLEPARKELDRLLGAADYRDRGLLRRLAENLLARAQLARLQDGPASPLAAAQQREALALAREIGDPPRFALVQDLHARILLAGEAPSAALPMLRTLAEQGWRPRALRSACAARAETCKELVSR